MARTEGFWKPGTGGSFLQTIYSAGINILINGLNKYINFNSVSGVTGYGFRDNNGVMEYKNSSGSWLPIGNAIVGGGDTNVQYNDGGVLAGIGNFVFDKIAKKLSILADYAAELAPALTSPNWTLGTGWTYGTSPNVIQKTANGTLNASPTPAISIVAGHTYRVIVSATVTVSGFTYNIGGVGSRNEINSTGTFIEYITASTSGNLIFLPSDTTARFVITAVSVKEITAGTGDIYAEGNISARGLKLYDTIVSQVNKIVLGAGSNNNVGNNGKRARLIQFILAGGNCDLTGLSLGQEDGQESYIVNFSPGTTLTVKHQDTNSLDVNRFQTPTNGDMVLEYGELCYCFYSGGTLKKWQIFKLTTAARQYNTRTSTAGGPLAFEDWLLTFIQNTDDMTLGQGNATIHLDNANGRVRIGDSQAGGNNNFIDIDDDNQVIDINSQGGKTMLGDTRGAADGSHISVDIPNQLLEALLANKWGLKVDGSIGQISIGDPNGSGNNTKIVIDDLNLLIKLTNLPTSDPGVTNAIWNDSGTLKISP